jgi:hypothetical protein
MCTSRQKRGCTRYAEINCLSSQIIRQSAEGSGQSDNFIIIAHAGPWQHTEGLA